MPNYIQRQSSVTDKLTTSITTYAQIERDAEKIAKHTLKRLYEVTPFNKEDIPNLGEHYIPIRIGEIKSKNTLGHYCVSKDTEVIEENGDVVGGHEILLNIATLRGRTAEQFFDLVSHETCHAWSGLLADTPKNKTVIRPEGIGTGKLTETTHSRPLQNQQVGTRLLSYLTTSS